MSGLVWSRDGADWPHREASEFVEAGGFRWHVQRMGRGAAAAADPRHRRRDAFLARADAAAGAAFHGDRAGPARPRLYPVAAGAPAVAAGHGGRSRRAAAQARRSRPEIAVGHSAGAAILARMCLDGSIAPAAAGQPQRRLHAVWRRRRQFVLAAGENAGAQSLRAAACSPGRRQHAGRGRAVDRQHRFERSIRRASRCIASWCASPSHVAAALRMMANWKLEPLLQAICRG